MQIAYDLFKSSGFSGNHTYTIELITALAQRFPEVHCNLVMNWNNRQDTGIPNGLQTVCNSRILPPPLLLGKALRTPVRIAGNILLKQAARRADLYHATNPAHFPDGVQNGVVTLHDLIALSEKPWTQEGSKRFYRNHIRSILSQAKIIFTVSEHTARDAREHFPETAGKLITTPLAASRHFSPRPYDPDLRTRHNAGDPAKPYLLYVGEIQPRKNIDGLLMAYDSLPSEQRSCVDLLLVGSVRSSSNRHYFEQALDRLGSQNGIYHLQNIPADDLARFYSNALLFIFPSFYEGFGLPVIEAMSCGCPVVTSDSTSLAEVASDAAMTVTPGDHEQLVHAISTMIDHDERRRAYRQRGLLRSETFSWHRTAELTMNGYKQALDP
ncbi:glycosyltransferase family 1 protein [Prosthecochloris sp. ZM_2]|uniref:glycosyltransferase family 4 protein n=1 Tax=Prosthecochloris sp. ZM_2 TaxID=2045206 RepID=UPI000DF748A0|nr:glycosyltransferase family 1 protein [Prosthecochloris sp. ZM_2]RNA64286.1 glycosyltransferase family 1 protein [Prosthecochloris sp. ZM_2]